MKLELEVVTREPKTKTKRKPNPLLFVHGSCHAAWCWDEHFLGYFARYGYSSHAVSLRGHGKSEGKDKLRWTSVKDYVCDVAQEVEEMKAKYVGEDDPPKPILIGHSLGCLVTRKYLEKHPEPAAVVLLAPSPTSGLLLAASPLLLKWRLLFVKALLKMDLHLLIGTPTLTQVVIFSASMEREKVEKYFKLLEKESFRAALEMLFDFLRPKQLECPILVLGAANDVIVRPLAINRIGRAYHATVENFPNMAHDMMLEDRWEDVAKYIRKWLKTEIYKKKEVVCQEQANKSFEPTAS